MTQPRDGATAPSSPQAQPAARPVMEARGGGPLRVSEGGPRFQDELPGRPALPPVRNLGAELVDRGDGWYVSPELVTDAEAGIPEDVTDDPESEWYWPGSRGADRAARAEDEATGE